MFGIITDQLIDALPYFLAVLKVGLVRSVEIKHLCVVVALKVTLVLLASLEKIAVELDVGVRKVLYLILLRILKQRDIRVVEQVVIVDVFTIQHMLIILVSKALANSFLVIIVFFIFGSEGETPIKPR